MFFSRTRGIITATLTRCSRVFDACLVLTAITTLSGCHDQPAPEAVRAPATVDVIDVALRDIPVPFGYVGQTQSSQQVEIRARVNGTAIPIWPAA